MAANVAPAVAIREFRKSKHEIVRVMLTEFAGRALADLRVWMPRSSDGVLVASRKGLTIDRALLPQLEEAVTALRAESDRTPVMPTAPEAPTNGR